MILSEVDRRTLLVLARDSITAEVRGEPRPPAPVEDGALARKAGVFVSLHERADGGLRGCIGTFASEWPLPLTIQEMACAAAFKDPRFPQLRPKEVAEITLEISVLSPPELIEDTSVIQVGTHGLYIVQGPSRGVLLPQVAVEQQWDRITFLENTCLKAGLDMNAWKEAETTISIFSAETFGEADMRSNLSAGEADRPGDGDAL